jgi:hypothetical protein
MVMSRQEQEWLEALERSLASGELATKRIPAAEHIHEPKPHTACGGIDWRLWLVLIAAVVVAALVRLWQMFWPGLQQLAAGYIITAHTLAIFGGRH